MIYNIGAMNQVNKLNIQNFGPIESGTKSFESALMPVNKITVLVGAQGSGKSTVAKIYSTCVWLEKAFVCGKVESVADYTLNDFVVLCGNQQIPESYFTENTIIEFYGSVLTFQLHGQELNVSMNYNNTGSYVRPKIMYIPSERNLLSILDNIENVENLPTMLSLLLEENRKALKKLDDSLFQLPINGFSVKYSPQNNKTYILNDGENGVEITQSSSGLQSLVPLLIVSDYLSAEVNRSLAENISKLSSRQKEAIKKGIENFFADDVEEKERFLKLLELISITKKTEGLSEKEIQVFEMLINFFVNKCFLNVVEEPEQNLFPEAQKATLEKLIENANKETENTLFLTTHSPYILESLNNCLYAAQLNKEKIEIADVFNENLCVGFENVTAYKIENGKIISILDESMQQIDSSYIDGCSDIINKTYSQLASKIEE